MKVFFVTFSLLTAIILLGSCRKTSVTSSTNNISRPPKPPKSDSSTQPPKHDSLTARINVAGNEDSLTSMGGHINKPFYWDGNQLYYLDNGVTAYATSICADSNNVYIGGNLMTMTNPSIGIGLYWKNFRPYALPSSSGVSSIAVSDTNVYAAGYQLSNLADPFSNKIPRYWVNDRAILLPDTSQSAYGYGLAISGTDVYVLGGNPNRGAPIPVYWKNGTPHYLEAPPLVDVVATDMAVSGQDVYISGYGKPSSNELSTIAFYWKNGHPTIFQDSSYLAFQVAFGIAVSGNDVYVAGVRSDENNLFVPVYWKNGIAVPLPFAPTFSRWTAWPIRIAVSGTDVYAVGRQYNGSNSASSAVFWKNNSEITLDLNNSSAEAIFIRK